MSLVESTSSNKMVQLFTARKRKSGSPVAEVDSFLKDLSLQASVGEGDTFDSHQYNFLDREFERLSESQQNPPPLFCHG